MKRNSSRPTSPRGPSAVTDKPMSATARTLEATAIREGRWWLVRFAELDAVGQARTIREIPAAAVDIAALHLGVPEETLEVHVLCGSPMKQSGSGMRPAASRSRPGPALQHAAELRRQAVRRARADGYKLDAAAAAFGVTTSRIQQIATDSDT